ncbi:hypothetical protein BJ912DRAFT_931544 [Pholiota molesta]|nr:hypothetical protein BJ912DRAFT_931544 [Pholiota molesta]
MNPPSFVNFSTTHTDYFDGRSREGSPVPTEFYTPPQSPEPLDLSDRSSGPLLRSSSASAAVSQTRSLLEPLVARSALTKAGSTPSLLTQEVLNMAKEALASYDVVRIQYGTCPPEEQPTTKLACSGSDAQTLQASRPGPFSSFSVEELERYFAAAIDTKNALQLRNTAVKADIGDSLGLLLPNLRLYDHGHALLSTVLDELYLLRGECSRRHIDLDYHALESFRYMFPLHTLSVLERYRPCSPHWKMPSRTKRMRSRPRLSFWAIRLPCGNIVSPISGPHNGDADPALPAAFSRLSSCPS